jgi:PAS domain S-box-containing protein
MVLASPDGIILLNEKGIISEVSEIGLQIFGARNKKELLGKFFGRFVSSSERKVVNKIMEKAKKTGIVQDVKITVRKTDRSNVTCEASVKLILDKDGQPIALMLIIRDITQRIKTEALQIHADRMSSLGEMASGIAHEINQPLNIISLAMDNIMAESARNGNPNNNLFKNKSEKIFENITRIRNIIDHIRDFSRSHDDHILTDFEINTSIRNAVSMISEQYKQHGIVLDLKLGSNIPEIQGNTFKFEQVILNLLSNAKDAVMEQMIRKAGSYKMKVGVSSCFRKNAITVEVTDNGTGIPEANINNVVLPFYTTKDSGKGTGLGLSICYQIIKEMEGTIEISSKPLAGTKIKIMLNIKNPR